MEALADAVSSLKLGSAWEPDSLVTPLIQPPQGALRRALDTLDEGESWLVKPAVDPDNPRLVSPGVKLGVRAGSFMHRSELFGPVLGVMRAEDLSHAIALANDTGYGLTAGLASLDEREQAQFLREMRAGNLYVNRTITGAIVERQPFGGLGKSGFGPGAKAGGPNYVLQLCRALPEAPPAPGGAPLRPLAPVWRSQVERFAEWLAADELAELEARLRDYAAAEATHFRLWHDPQRLLGQDNGFRYLPEQHLVLRVEEDAGVLALASSVLAARLSGASLSLSISPRFRGPHDSAELGYPVALGELADLRATLREGARVRLLGARRTEHDALAAQLGLHIADAPVLACGRLELLHYLREQSVSVEYHRYGQIPRDRAR
jgi:RHH-type proline utilization regulon transcriptional repressor/proline dehydrogenase/delta 1-pyrroline-5-carboxylate dehydrogenase